MVGMHVFDCRRHTQGTSLEYSDPPALAPCVNVSHDITEASPLHSRSLEDLAAEDGAIFVSMSATDERSLQPVFARMIYRSEDIVFNHRFQVGSSDPLQASPTPSVFAYAAARCASGKEKET